MNYYIDIGADGQDLMNHMVDQDFDYIDEFDLSQSGINKKKEVKINLG